MKADEVFDVDVKNVVPLDGEDWVFDVVVVHVYSDGVCASDIFDVWLVFDMDARFDVVPGAEAIS